MANGTIAFDTLSTSGQISGTAKSVDADYLSTGSAKAWAQYEHDPVINKGFNTASITDNATGDQSITYTNNMDGTAYAVTTSGTVDDSSYQVFVSVDHDRGGPRPLYRGPPPNRSGEDGARGGRPRTGRGGWR